MHANGISLLANNRILNGKSSVLREAIVEKAVSNHGHRDFCRLPQSCVIFCAVVCMLLLVNVAEAQIRFQDTTNAAGGPFYTGETWGAAWGDINGDIYPDMFSNNHGDRNGLYRNNGDGTFTDVTENADIDRVWIDEPRGDFHGAAFADFDNDGDQDIFATRSSRDAHIQLMENNGQGRFEQNSAQYNIRPYGGGRMPLLFDYTNDGYLDAAIARNDSAGLEIFRFNPGNNRYVRTTDQVGIAGECLRNNYAFISDLFNNNKLHYVCMPEAGVAERVYDMSTIPFTDVSNKIDNVGVYTDAVLADFNGDLRQDIFALRGRIRPSGAQRISSQRIEAWFSVGGTTAFEKSMRFRANGPISIHIYARDVGEAGGLRIGSSGYNPNRLPATLSPTDSQNFGLVSNRNGVSVYAGYNQNTQEWTVLLGAGGNGDSENSYITVSGNGLTQPVVTGLVGSDGPVSPAFLLNNGNILDNVGSRGLPSLMCGGVAAADFDNDMDVDLYLACRTGTENIRNRLYLNNGNGQFSEVTGFGGEGLLGAGIDGRQGTAEMVVAADYDVDGFMDLFVTNGNRLFPHIVKDRFSGGGQIRFIRNLGNNNRWIQIDLEGRQSNRDGFGAKVFATAGGTTQVREKNGSYHRWSHDSQRIHFGLRNNTQANIRIEWPDGSVDVHNNVASNRLYRAVQNGALTVRSNGNPSGGGGPSGDPEVSIDDVTANEADGEAQLTISLSEPASSPSEVRFASASGSATSGSDFTSRSGTIVFNTGQTQATRAFQITQDNIDEANETFTVQLSNPDGLTIARGTGTVTIIDDDNGGNPPPPPPPSGGPEFSITSVEVDEGDGSAVLTVSLSEAAPNQTQVNFASASGTATMGADFTGRSGRITFSAGETQKTRTFDINQDNISESAETFTVQLSNSVGAGIAVGTGVVTIIDDDGSSPPPPPPPPAGGPVISVSGGNVSEGGLLRFTFTLSEPSTEIVRLEFTTVADGTATSDVDFESRSGTARFLAGQLEAIRDITTLSDNASEPNETFSVRISNAENATISVASAVGTILDDDGGSPPPPPPPPSGPEFSINDMEIEEGEGSAVLTVSLSEPVSSQTAVRFASVSGTAISGDDFTDRSGRVVFSAGETQKTRTFDINQDNQAESTESFTVELSDVEGAEIGVGVGTVTIIDDDGGSPPPPPPPPAGGPVISVSGGNVSEGGLLRFTFTLSEPSTEIVRLEFTTVADGTATSDVDFESRSGTARFLAGQLEAIRDITTLSDNASEPNETFSVRISNAENATISVASAVGTILDDDGGSPPPPPNSGPTFSITDMQVEEGEGSAALTISLSEPLQTQSEVRFTAVSGTATSGADFIGRSGRIVFSAGETQKTRTFDINQDNLAESTESFTVQLSAAVGATIANGVGTITIVDDDGGNAGGSGGGSNDAVCGEPNLTGGNAGNIYIWRDCAGDGRWHINASYASSFVQFLGQVNTDGQVVNVSTTNFDSNDNLDGSSNTRLRFLMRGQNNDRDDIEFDVVGGTQACFALNAPNRPILAGRNSTSVASGFNIETLAQCN